MRWNETCTLIGKTYALDDEGVPQPKDDPKTVYCNQYSLGAVTWSFRQEIGLSRSAELQVRTCDYGGERDVLYKGDVYSVEVADEHGDFTRLVMRRQTSDSENVTGEEEEDDG